MTKIELRDFKIAFDKTPIVDIQSLVFESKMITSLVGYSGSGKSSILKAIAGIGGFVKGSIYFDEVDVSNFSPQARKIGYVPQHQVLFPTLNVQENIAFGLKSRRVSKTKIKQRVKEIADFTGSSHLLKRKPSKLSGGESQRVALARALAPEPEILLLDEPLSSLDTSERMRMALILKEIISNLKISTIYVTHSPQECEIMSDRVIVLGNGRVLQHDKFSEIKLNPSNLQVAKFFGIKNSFSHLPENLIENKESYRVGGIFIINPQRVRVSKVGIEAKVIAHSEDFTIVSTCNLHLAMNRIDVVPNSKVFIKIE